MGAPPSAPPALVASLKWPAAHTAPALQSKVNVVMHTIKWPNDSMCATKQCPDAHSVHSHGCASESYVDVTLHNTQQPVVVLCGSKLHSQPTLWRCYSCHAW